ncbi:unnamed protein product [Paramecium primaurelia]|uniref:Uncharacterized protein n=1 Tax=Paramecium primaurelia TaxID=5886 RepID=A0A8S1MSS3_PARPR|nr:unnamed protein product [Paramecium primaurelia]
MTTTLPFISKNKNYVEMKAVTWQKDSHGLFDYETKSLSVKKHRVEGSCKVSREENEIVIQDGKAKDEAHLPLTSIQAQGDQYFIQPNQNSTENENYLIVRSLKNADGVQKGYTLQEGDLLKLGRVEYHVIEIRDSKGQIRTVKDVFQSEAKITPSLDGNVTQQCKICLNEEETPEDPFITPCKCNGSCAYVHFNCLKQWLESRGYKKESGNTISYRWKKLECEVCQELLPQQIRFKGKVLDLAALERPNQPYIILENTQISEKDKKAQRGIYLIKGTPDDQIKLGRGHQCEIRISDISVSRLHAFIKYEKGNFVIVDNNSKFGTLVRLQTPYLICMDKIAIQVGRTVLTFVMKSFQSLNPNINGAGVQTMNMTDQQRAALQGGGQTGFYQGANKTQTNNNNNNQKKNDKHSG